MFNRRKFLAFLGLAPAMPLLAKLPVVQAAPAVLETMISGGMVGTLLSHSRNIERRFESDGRLRETIEGKMLMGEDHEPPDGAVFALNRIPDVRAGFKCTEMRMGSSANGRELTYRTVHVEI